MSIERVNNFRDQVNHDPAMQGEVLALLQAERMNGVAALGEKYGFTVEEAEMAMSGNDGELSDFELEMVQAAGLDPSCYGTW